jgi:hypothetical protein
VAAIDGVVRALVERQLDQPVLAIAGFRISGTDTGLGTPAAVNPFSVGGWLQRRRQITWPAPAYLAVSDATISIFSARFDRGTRLLGPLMVWRRDVLVAAAVEDSDVRVRVRPVPNRPAIELEAVERGPEATAVIRHLCLSFRDEQ